MRQRHRALPRRPPDRGGPAAGRRPTEVVPAVAVRHHDAAGRDRPGPPRDDHQRGRTGLMASIGLRWIAAYRRRGVPLPKHVRGGRPSASRSPPSSASPRRRRGSRSARPASPSARSAGEPSEDVSHRRGHPPGPQPRRVRRPRHRRGPRRLARQARGAGALRRGPAPRGGPGRAARPGAQGPPPNRGGVRRAEGSGDLLPTRPLGQSRRRGHHGHAVGLRRARVGPRRASGSTQGEAYCATLRQAGFEVFSVRTDVGVHRAQGHRRRPVPSAPGARPTAALTVIIFVSAFVEPPPTPETPTETPTPTPTEPTPTQTPTETPPTTLPTTPTQRRTPRGVSRRPGRAWPSASRRSGRAGRRGRGGGRGAAPRTSYPTPPVGSAAYSR